MPAFVVAVAILLLVEDDFKWDLDWLWRVELRSEGDASSFPC